MQTQIGTCIHVLGYKSLPDSTPQRHAAAIPGIKLSHYVITKLLAHRYETEKNIYQTNNHHKGNLEGGTPNSGVITANAMLCVCAS
jgi:hypothetical protein